MPFETVLKINICSLLLNKKVNNEENSFNLLEILSFIIHNKTLHCYDFGCCTFSTLFH